MDFFTHSFFKINLKNVAILGFIWGCLGFALGCATLLGPVRWLVTFAREHHYSDSAENLLVKAVIVLFMLISLMVALSLTRYVLLSTSGWAKFSVPLGVFLLAMLALSLFLNPRFLNEATAASQDTSHPGFTFGPYPTAEQLKALKAEGYIGIISLLHPAVTPFEPVLLQEEQAAGAAIGISIISIPMLPWISQNQEAIARIKALAAKPRGRYYVHCYLGKDRVNVVKRIIGQHATAAVKSASTDKAGSVRSLDDISRFERGKITKLEPGVYFVPFPTDEEYMGYVIAPGVKQVVSLLDPQDPEAKTRIDQEQQLLETYQINFKLFPITEAVTQKQINNLLDTLAALPRPLVIHRFFTRETEQKIIDAYRARKETKKAK